MAATDISWGVTASNYADGVADIAAAAVDSVNNNSFTNTGQEIIIITNGSGGVCSVTFPNVPASRYTLNDVITKTPNGTIANGDVAFYGPFPLAVWPTTVEIAYSTGTSVTIAVVTIQETTV